MRREVLATLVGYCQGQKETIAKLLGDLGAVDPDSEANSSHLGFMLHNLYCAVEDLFREIAKTFENRIGSSAEYHLELLKRMRIDVPSFRPRVLSDESFRILDELGGFRHVFRHAYEFRLSAKKLRDLKSTVLSDWDKVERDLDAFVAFLVSHPGN